VAGSGEQVLFIREGGIPQWLSWSPDGKRIEFGLSYGSDKKHRTIALFDVATHRETPFITFPDKRIFELRWTPVGRGLLVRYTDRSSNYSRGQIGSVSYPEGKFEPVTADTNHYNTLRLSADGRTMTTIQSQCEGEFDLLPASGIGTATVVPGIAKVIRQIRGGDRLSNSDLLLVLPDKLLRPSLDGAKQTEIFSDNAANVSSGRVCGGAGSIVVTMEGRQGHATRNLCRMDGGGTNLQRPTAGEDDILPVCCSEGTWIYYFSSPVDPKSGNANWMCVPLEGGFAEKLPSIGVPGSATFFLTDPSRGGKTLVTPVSIADQANGAYRKALPF
jgi:hypothetical protein